MDMFVSIQINIPLELATKLKLRHAALSALLGVEEDKFKQRVRTVPDPEKLAKERAALDERRKVMTIHNMTRVMLYLGAAGFDKLSDEALAHKLITHAVKRGRPYGS
jgi:hypothetical protein